MYPYKLKFDSLKEAVEYAEKKHDPNGDSVNISDQDWYDNYIFDEFITDFKCLENKNRHKKADKIQRITQYLTKYINENKKHLMPQNIFEEVYDVSGSIVDVAKYLESDPNCFINFLGNKKKNAINLIFQASNAGGCSQELELMGIIIYCLNNILKNRSVNLYGYTNTSNKIFILYNFSLSNRVEMVSQLELVLLNLKAFFRRIGFGVKESCPDEIRKDVGIEKHRSYGFCAEMEANQIKEMFGIVPDILITPKFFKGNEEKSCKKIIKKMVNILKI